MLIFALHCSVLHDELKGKLKCLHGVQKNQGIYFDREVLDEKSRNEEKIHKSFHMLKTSSEKLSHLYENKQLGKQGNYSNFQSCV